MPIYHKFMQELSLESLSYIPRILFINTFIADCQAEKSTKWFYGNLQGDLGNLNRGNYFWAIVPRLFNELSLKFEGAEALWKDFCEDYGIACTSLISSINDKEMEELDLSDEIGGLHDQFIVNECREIALNDITGILMRYPSIKAVYLTRDIENSFWDQCWKPIASYCESHGIYVRTLADCSDYASSQYDTAKAGGFDSTEDYLFDKWAKNWLPADKL